jgi:hypothetical protein
MSCDTCHECWLEIERARILLRKAQYERDRNRGIHIVKDEVKTLQEAVTHAEEVYEKAMDRWETHRATHHDDAAKSRK